MLDGGGGGGGGVWRQGCLCLCFPLSSFFSKQRQQDFHSKPEREKTKKESKKGTTRGTRDSLWIFITPFRFSFGKLLRSLWSVRSIDHGSHMYDEKSEGQGRVRMVV